MTSWWHIGQKYIQSGVTAKSPLHDYETNIHRGFYISSYYFCIALLNVLASERCIWSQLQMANNLTQQYVWWAWIIWNDVKHRRALCATLTPRAMSITVGAEWKEKLREKYERAENETRKRTVEKERPGCPVPQPYWWLPQPKFCSPGWFDSCSVSSSAAWSAVCWHLSWGNGGTENTKKQ